MDRVDVNAHLDDTGISHGTKQGVMEISLWVLIKTVRHRFQMYALYCFLTHS